MDWKNAPVALQPLQFPATSTVIGFCCAIWYLIYRHGIGYGDVGSSYQMVIHEKQYWRAITASFSHISLVHLGFNMYSTWQLKNVEQMIGAVAYFRLTFAFLVLSIAFQQFLHFGLTYTSVGERTRNTVGVGYSCVVFAWMTWVSLHTTGTSLDFLFFKVPYSLSPFASLIMTQLMIPNVDFVGHLAGILAGYWQGWGMNGWMDTYWTVVLSFWTVMLFVASLVWSGKRVPYIEQELLTEAERRNLNQVERELGPLAHV